MTSITTVKDIKNSPDILGMIFDCAGNYTTFSSVCKAWNKSCNESYFSKQWNILKKKADPVLLSKMTFLESHFSKMCSKRLFQNLHGQLKMLAPPVQKTQKDFFIDVASYVSSFFLKKSEEKIDGPDLVTLALNRQQSADHYNQSRIGNRFIEGTELLLNALALTELPVSVVKKRMKSLFVYNNFLHSLPEELMNNYHLRHLRIDRKLYSSLPEKMRRYLSLQIKLGRCKQCSYVGYGRVKGADALTFSAIDRAPSIFYDGCFFSPKSLLGRLYQATLQNLSEEEVSEIFEHLNKSDKDHIWHFIWVINGSRADISKHYFAMHTFANLDTLCQAVYKTILLHFDELPPESKDKLYVIIDSLEEGQTGLDPFRENDLWVRHNFALANTARLADGLMYLEREKETSSIASNSTKKSNEDDEKRPN